MKIIRAATTIAIPEGVKISVKSRVVTVTGKHLGDGKERTLERNFRHLPVQIMIIQDPKDAEKQLVEVSSNFALAKQRATLRTVCSHIDNMITGVQKRYRYFMRLVYNHFPITPTFTDKGKGIEIRNFLGEKIVRKIAMLGDTTVVKSEAQKDELIIEGTDIDNTSRSAALIHQSCLVKDKDIRKFLDGIYVSEKTFVHLE